jgi:hypothetical protein
MMDSKTAPETRFTSEQEPQAEKYRPLSGLAVTAFLLGLLSPAAILGMYALVIPILGAGLAAAAVWRIHAGREDLSGRRLALVGLALSLFFAAWPIAESVGRQWLVAREAKQFCDGWLQLLKDGKVHEAHQWTLAPGERVPESLPLDTYYRDSESSQEAARQFFNLTPVPLGESGSVLREFRYLGNESIVRDTYSAEVVVTHRYAISYLAEGDARTGEATLRVARIESEETSVVFWTLREFRLAAPAR